MIVAKSNIKHDGELYEKGKEIPNLSDEQAAKLIADGVAEDSTKPVVKEEAVANAQALEAETQKEIAGLEAKPTMSRTRLLGIARAKGIKVSQEATRTEIFKAIQAVSEEASADGNETPDEPPQE